MTSHNPGSMPAMEDYCTNMRELRFSDDTKARMAARLAEEATKRRPSDSSVALPRHRRLPLAAVAAGIALALGTGGIAYATGSFMSVQRLVRHLFGAQEPKVEVVDKIGRPVGVAQSVGGVTVSADAIIGDKTSLAVVFSVAKDDGTPFEGVEALDNGLLPLGFSENLDIDFPLVSRFLQGAGATGSSYFYDADPTDNAIQLVETRTYTSRETEDIDLVGSTLTARFSDLTLYGEDEPTVIAPGEWELSFPLDYDDATVALPGGESFELEGFFEDDATRSRERVGTVGATVDELSISPIALHVKYTAKRQVTWTSGESGRESERDARLSDLLLSLPASVTMRDGSTIELTDYAGGTIYADDDGTHVDTSIFFDRILDLDEVASVTIGGTAIEL